ncbi:MAG: hypothetical protein AAF485_17820, partial [Chloroflexota bacterium]
GNQAFRFSTGSSTFGQETGVRFTSGDGRPFYGVAALDDGKSQDWGYALLPANTLATQVLVGWGPGNNNSPPDGAQSPLYVTAATTTTIHVDFDNNGVTDISIPVLPLVETPISDTTDFDMTGAFLFTAGANDPFVAVWGQARNAITTSPSIDLGASIVPLRSLAIQKSLSLVNDSDGSGTLTWGDIVRFHFTTFNNSVYDINPAIISDTLPSTISYVPNSSTVNNASISDDTLGTTIFPFDEGGHLIGILSGAQIVTATFDGVVNQNVNAILNTAAANSPITPPAYDATIQVPLVYARYELDKYLLDPTTGQAEAGQVITFGVAITSTGTITITKLPLRDVFNSDHLTFIQANPSPDLIQTGVITWSDLATTTQFGPLPPNRTITLTVAFTVAQSLPSSILNTLNTVTVEGAQGSDGSNLLASRAQAQVNFPTPTPTMTPSPTPTTPPENTPAEDVPTSPSIIPSPTPTATLASVPVITTVPTVFPVKTLPETGHQGTGLPIQLLIIMAVVAFIGLRLLRYTT